MIVTAFVAAGFECPAGSLVVGAPAKVKRALSEEEIDWKTRGTREYQELARRCLGSMDRAEALSHADEDREGMKTRPYEFKP